MNSKKNTGVNQGIPIRKTLVYIISIIISCTLMFNILLNVSKGYEEVYQGEIIEEINYFDGFEDIGKYSVAVAGNNNGTLTNELIEDYPSDWENIKSNIPDDILSEVDNMSGSYLEYDGTVQEAIMNYCFYTTNSIYTFDILIIEPDGSYKIYKDVNTLANGKYSFEVEIDQSGWYYVSILNASYLTSYAQLGWTLTAIYENDDLPYKYIKIVAADSTISNGESTEVYYNSLFEQKDNFDIFGVVLSGGLGGKPKEGYTEDTFEAILENETYQQLYEDEYNGKTIFEGRTDTDFINDTFNTIRSHNIAGGELDIFYESLGKDYFGGEDLLGYRITKIGKNGIDIAFLGMAYEIDIPTVTITTTIINNEDYFSVGGNIHTQVCVANTSSNVDATLYGATITSSLDVNLSNASNIIVKINGDEKSNITTTYDSINNQVIISEIDINTDDEITIEYDAEMNENIENYDNMDYVTLETIATVKGYAIDIETLENEEDKEKYSYLYVEEKSEDEITGQYYEEERIAYKTIIVNKVWQGDTTKTQDGEGNEVEEINSSRPTEVTVELSATVSGESYDITGITTEPEVTLTENRNWTYSWENLPKYTETGQEIEYSIQETSTFEDYYLSSITSDTTVDGEITYTVTNSKYGSITLTKVDNSNKDTKLGGATFKLEKLLEENEEYVVDESFEAITCATDSDTQSDTFGTLTFENLEYGTYRITETVAPEGYSLSTDTLIVTVDSDNVETSVTAKDKKKTTLPETGQKGIFYVIIAGIALLIIGIKTGRVKIARADSTSGNTYKSKH